MFYLEGNPALFEGRFYIWGLCKQKQLREQLDSITHHYTI